MADQFKEFMASIENCAEDTAEKMAGAKVCLMPFEGDWRKNAFSLLQFAIALMMDKPILVIAPQGRKISAKVRKIADGIAFYDPKKPNSHRQAIEKLLKDAMADEIRQKKNHTEH